MKKIVLFSEASAVETVGGYGTILLYSGKERLLSGKKSNTTANRMELYSVMEGLRVLKEPCDIEIVTSSLYVTKSISVWLDRWIKRDFDKVKNLELWQEYMSLAQGHTIKATFIQTTLGHSENERCEQMAQQVRSKI